MYIAIFGKQALLLLGREISLLSMKVHSKLYHRDSKRETCIMCITREFLALRLAYHTWECFHDATLISGDK